MVKKVRKNTITETVSEDGTKKTVVKGHTPKSSKKKKKNYISREKTSRAREKEDLLIENFVGLQHAMTNMSVKFGVLSDSISKLLEIFEESARGFVSGGKPDDKDMLNKINSLLEQNKTIANGLVVMEEKLRDRKIEHKNQQIPMESRMSQSRPKPLPRI